MDVKPYGFSSFTTVIFNIFPKKSRLISGVGVILYLENVKNCFTLKIEGLKTLLHFETGISTVKMVAKFEIIFLFIESRDLPSKSPKPQQSLLSFLTKSKPVSTNEIESYTETSSVNVNRWVVWEFVHKRALVKYQSQSEVIRVSITLFNNFKKAFKESINLTKLS